MSIKFREASAVGSTHVLTYKGVTPVCHQSSEEGLCQFYWLRNRPLYHFMLQSGSWIQSTFSVSYYRIQSTLFSQLLLSNVQFMEIGYYCILCTVEGYYCIKSKACSQSVTKYSLLFTVRLLLCTLTCYNCIQSTLCSQLLLSTVQWQCMQIGYYCVQCTVAGYYCIQSTLCSQPVNE